MKIFDYANKIIGLMRKKSIPSPKCVSPTSEYGIVKYKSDIDSANLIIEKLRETVEIMDNTVKPEVFFRRLHYSFDCMLELMTYKSNIFKGISPEEQYRLQLEFLETRVNNFIDRSYNDAIKNASKLKTETGRQKRINSYFTNMESAFKNAHNFWKGNTIAPHYTGRLYTGNNYKKLIDLSNKTIIID